MALTITRGSNSSLRHRLLPAVVAGLALCLAVPSVALAASSTRPAVHAATARSHHFGGSTGHIVLSGSVVSIGTGSIVIQDKQGFWRTIVLSSSTTYSEGPMTMQPAASSSDLAVGSTVEVSGTVDADHTSLDAVSVRIELSSVRGVVTSVTLTSATLTTVVVTVDQSSTPMTIDVNPQTVVFTHGGVVTLASVVVGSAIEAFGLPQTDGSLLALYLGVKSGHEGFDHNFGFSVPNRTGPNHFHGLGHKR